MLTTQLNQPSAHHAAYLHADAGPRDIEEAPASGVVSRRALDQAAGGALPEATRATLAFFSRGALVDARAFSF